MNRHKKGYAKSPKPANLALRRIAGAHAESSRAIVFYVLVLAFICAFLSFDFKGQTRLYVAGEVAESDVTADRYMLVEDTAATEARRRQMMLSLPPVYDFSMEPYIHFEQRLIALMREYNGAPSSDDRESPSETFARETGGELAQEILPQFGLLSTQSFVLKKLLPLLRDRLAEGMVGDLRSARIGPSGVIVRNLDTGSETLKTDISVLPDVQSFLTEISTLARNDKNLSHNARRAVNVILAASMPPTLTLNQEATRTRAAMVALQVEPVYYQIQKGELIARRGEIVTEEQQLKIQAMYQSPSMPFDWRQALGSFLLCAFISLGFFVSPSGKRGNVVHSKDLALMSIVSLLVAVSAKGVHALGELAATGTLAQAFAVAFPVAGAVGFVATIFSARRYVTLGLLLSILAGLALQLSIYFTLFHFVSSMLATWLVSHTVSRQDAVWNLFPFIIGELLLILGVMLVDAMPLSSLPMFMTAVCVNAVLMLILFFSFSPILETIFGYSTRFKLMEYINLEQPLMQEIMVSIPGTYHHSLVVANMVEAGAKAIGANSLLCKVAALYHDSGKLVYPQYFVENQFGAPNKHDKLSPSMSALIIISHVKKGVEICRRYGLGKEIVDIIAQHHGDRVMRYFYQKSLQLGENPNEADFSYDGPKPQSREAAILMLADSVEASSRTLTDPTPTRLRAHIDKIVKGILSEGQLDESELTFRDLNVLAESFQQVLTGIFHHRIVYPEAVKPEAKDMPVEEAAHPLAQAFVRREPAEAEAKQEIELEQKTKAEEKPAREAGTKDGSGSPEAEGRTDADAKNGVATAAVNNVSTVEEGTQEGTKEPADTAVDAAVDASRDAEDGAVAAPEAGAALKGEETGASGEAGQEAAEAPILLTEAATEPTEADYGFDEDCLNFQANERGIAPPDEHVLEREKKCLYDRLVSRKA